MNNVEEGDIENNISTLNNEEVDTINEDIPVIEDIQNSQEF